MARLVRRYLTIIQDPAGYPAPGEPLEPAPPDGPAPPVMHSVVLADDYEALLAALERLRDERNALRPIVEHVAGLAVQDEDGYSRVHLALIEEARTAVRGDD